MPPTSCCICLGGSDSGDDGGSSDSVGGDNSSVSATECGHVFHEACLARWLSRSRSCPTCRKPLRQDRVFRLFLNPTDFLLSDGDDADVLLLLRRQLSDARDQLEAAAASERRQQEVAAELRASLDQIEGAARNFNVKYVDALRENCCLRADLRAMRQEAREKRQLARTNMLLQAQLVAKERQLESDQKTRYQLTHAVSELCEQLHQREGRIREQADTIRALTEDVEHYRTMLHTAEVRLQTLREKTWRGPRAADAVPPFTTERSGRARRAPKRRRL